MKQLPEHPPNWKEVFDKESQKVLTIFRDKEARLLITEFNKRYLYWSELKYRIQDSEKRKYIWVFMKILRSDKYELLPINSIKLQYTSLPELNRNLNKFDKSLAGHIGIQTKTLDLQKRYLVSSLMEEAIASSMIEGAATTRKVAKEMLRTKRKPTNKSEKMIVNNYETMQFILEQRQKKVTPELLLEIQKRITKDTMSDPSDSGKFRDNNDIVVADNSIPELIAHTPPDYKEIPKLIDELCKFANDDEQEFMHPVLKAITLHFLIGYIHPFNDGNGRTARSVFYWYLISREYWLTEYLAVSRRIVRSRKNYDLAYLYTEYDELDLTYFFKYNLQCISDALTDLSEYIKKKQKEQEQTKKLISDNFDLNLRQGMIIEEFLRNPSKTFTILEIAHIYKTVYQTARTDLLLLEKKGFIEKRLSGKAFVFTYKSKEDN